MDKTECIMSDAALLWILKHSYSKNNEFVFKKSVLLNFIPLVLFIIKSWDTMNSAYFLITT